MKQQAVLILFFVAISSLCHVPKQLSLGSGTYNQYLKSTSDTHVDLGFLIKPTRKPISRLIDDFNPASESFKMLESGIISPVFMLKGLLGEHKAKANESQHMMMLNFSYMNSNENIYLLQNGRPGELFKSKKSNLFQRDIVVNVTDDKSNNKIKIGVDIDYNNKTQIVMGNSTTVIIKDNNSTDNTSNDGFLKKKLADKGNKLIKDSVLDCSDPNNVLPVQTVCSLCETTVAYLLNDDNWYKIGLINNQRKGYSDFLSTLSTLMQNSTYFISFSDDAICVSSDQIVPNVTLNSLTTEFTGKPISTFQLSNGIFQLDSMQSPIFFQVKYLVNVAHYDQFKFIYQPNTNYSLFNLIHLSANRIELNGNNDTVKIQGSFDLNSTFFFEFHHQYHYLEKAPESLLLSVDDLGLSPQNSFDSFFLKLFGASLSAALLDELTISRGLSELDKLRIKGLLLRVYLSGPKNGLAVVNLQVDYVPDFSISPEFLLYDCLADYLIFLEGNPLSFTWKFLIDCACKRFEDIARMYILRSEGQEHIYLNATRQNITLKTIEEKLFETGVHVLDTTSNATTNETTSLLYKDAGFFNEMRRSVDLQKYVDIVDGLHIENGCVDDFSTEIFFSPQLTYKVSGSFFITELLLQGNLNAIVSNIGGTMASAVHLEFPLVAPEKLLKGFLSISTVHALEALGQTVKPLKLVLLTSSRDIDLKNYVFIKGKNSYNESFWQRGVHLSYSFQLQNDCKDNRFCTYMAQNYNPTHIYTLKGELSHQERLVLLGDPQQATPQPEPVNFTPKKIQLVVPLGLNNSSNNDQGEDSNSNASMTVRNKSINFQLIGDYLVGLEDNKTLVFNSELSFFREKIMLFGDTSTPWGAALALPTLNLSQISMRAHVDSLNYTVRTLELSALGVFGRDCFLQTANQSLFQKSRCFYGDADIAVSPKNFHRNYLEGYFENANIWNILFSGLDYDSFRDYDLISKHISNIRLTNGADIVYSMQDLDIYSQRFKNDSTTVEKRSIPAGFSIKAVSEVLGLEGVLLMNLDSNTKLVSGVFELNSAISFAGGNAVVLQTDLNSSEIDSSVVFNINSTAIPQEKQVSFLGKVNFFNTQSNLNMSVTNDEYRAKLSGKIFQGLYDFGLELTAPYNQSLQQASFKVRGRFSKELIQDLQDGLKNKTLDWIAYVKYILARLDDKIAELKTLLAGKQKELCNEALCPKELQCVDEPKQRCIEYSVKTVCKSQHSFCLKPEQTCLKQQQVCVAWNKTCVITDDSTGQCVEYKNMCADYIGVCSEWKHVCNAETVVACEDFETETDENDCQRSEFVCKVREVSDVICQNDCKLRKKQFEKYQKLYTNLITAKEAFNKKLTGFWIMNAEVQKNPSSFLMIPEGKFETPLSDIIDPRSLKMQVPVVSFKEDLNNNENLDLLEERNFDFKDIDDFGDRLFRQLSGRWSKRFDFDLILLKENQADLLNSLFMTVDEDVEHGLATALVGNVFE